ncbi:MAG TPA: alpha/beta hydrolase [Thermodesulfobacteriota bacterium]
MKISKIIPLLLLLGGFVGCNTQITTVQAQTETVAFDRPQSVDVRGEKLHYIELGEGEPLIFIHGSIGDYRVWISRMEPYSEGYHVVAYSRRYAWPNKQEFDETVDYSVRIHADDLYELIKDLGLKKVNIVGHSYGAFTALTMALEHPEVVKSLVLGEPPASSLAKNTEKGRASWEAFLEDHIRPAKQDFQADKNEEALEHFLKGVLGDDFQLDQVPPEIKQGWMDNLLETWGYSMSVDFWGLDPEAIESLDIPVLLLVGNISPTWLIEISKELHRLLPQSEMVLFENMNHRLYFEQPEAVDQAVMEFLGRN